MGEKPAVDWERIETDYRVGTKTLREIASEHGITEGAIRKRAKAQTWPRDLAAKVRARADALVRKELVRSEVRKDAKNERETVEIEAEVRARLEMSQRGDSAELRTATMSIVREVGAVSEHASDLSHLAELMIDPESDKTGKLREAFDKVLSLPGRAKTLKDAAETAIKAIELERRVNRMDEGVGEAGGFERILAEIHAATTA